MSELLSEREGIDIGRTTLRRILAKAGLSSPRRRRPPKHRVRRQRMPREGMLIQLDGSYHRWLGDRSPPLTCPQLLLAAPRRHRLRGSTPCCRMKTPQPYFLLMQKHLLRRRGSPRPLYRPPLGVFKHKWNTRPLVRPPSRNGRWQNCLQMIFLPMVVAPGQRRVERAAGTFQDRGTELPGRSNPMEQAKAVLKQFLPRFNRRLNRFPPSAPILVFRPLP